MQIVINDSDEHNDYFTLTDDDGAEYKWHGRKGMEQDPEKVLLLIRQKEYPGYRFTPLPLESKLQAFERWIAEGHEVNGEVIPKVTWVSTHPIVKNKIVDVIEIDQESIDLYQQIKAQATADNNLLVLGVLQLLKRLMWG